MQETPWPGGIDHKLRSDLHWPAVPGSGEAQADGFFTNFAQRGIIQISYAEIFCLGNQIVIEVRAIPMGIRDFFVGTCSDEKLIPMPGIRLERLSKLMMVECEPALDSAGKLWKLLLPRSPFAQRPHERQVVLHRDFLQQQIGQRS